MLEYLYVKNLALIQEVELKFSDHLNILSGETGAGKSVLLGSVGLALGGRADTDMIRTGTDTALVELLFRVNEKEAEKLREMDIEPEDGEVIISRKISQGKSQGKINGETVPVSLLKKAASCLINVHGQHEHETLLSEENHLVLLDRCGHAVIESAKEKYLSVYREYRNIKEKITHMGGDDEARKRELDFLSYEIEEIEEAEIRVGEEEDITKELRKLNASKLILEGLAVIAEAVSGDTADRLSDAVREAMQLRAYDESMEDLSVQLKEIESLLSDAARDVRERIDNTETDEEKIDRLSERLDLIGRMKQKYGGSEERILETCRELKKRYEELEAFDADKEAFLEKLREQRKKLISEAGVLHEVRKAAAAEFDREMQEALQDLNFMSVCFRTEVTETNRYTSDGADEVCFMISTNPGEPLKPLSKVASGGELSRIMLAVKSITAGADDISTLIFDEIDTGISGRTAGAVAAKMKKIAADHQVICISHLPQIVAAADHHFLIEKSVEDEKTLSRIRELDPEESICEIARLSAVGELTQANIDNARELKKLLNSKNGE